MRINGTYYRRASIGILFTTNSEWSDTMPKAMALVCPTRNHALYASKPWRRSPGSLMGDITVAPDFSVDVMLPVFIAHSRQNADAAEYCRRISASHLELGLGKNGDDNCDDKW